MILVLTLSLILLSAAPLLGLAKVYHAFPDNSCSEAVSLLQQGQYCSVGGAGLVECLKNLKDPGDECRLHAGRYPFRGDPLPVRGLHGTKDKPFVVAAAIGEEANVILDGTLPVTTKISDWSPMASRPRIYSAKAQTDFWQMFVDGRMQTNARWPNALWSDWSVFNVSHWAHSANNSDPAKGIMVDDGSSGPVPFDQVNITGAVAILNTGSWDSYPAIVLSHQPGSNSFTYNASGQYHDDAIHNRYYLEDALDFIDLPSEWFYDKDTQRAYWFPEDGQGPQAQSRIVGKVSTYAFNITNCSFVQFANMTFFATTFWASSLDEHLGSPERSFIDNLTFTSLNFSYPSYSKRMLKDVRPPMWTLVSSLFYRPGTEDIMARHANKNKMTDEQLPGYGADTDHGFHKIVNCTWMYADSPALNVQGKFCNISNNYFAYNDWSGADEDVAIGAQSTLNNDRGIGDIFHRNTLYKNGASTGYRPPPGSNISFNHIVAQCWGDIQHDGAGMQVMAISQSQSIVHHNWVHSSVKYGIRFDGQPPRTGSNGTLQYNVAWNCGGLLVKGEYHFVSHNLAFNLTKETPKLKAGQNCSLCVYGYVRDNPVHINNFTVTVANAADYINGGTGNGGHSKEKKVEPLPGHAYNNIQSIIRDEVMDADNYDFRPRKNSTFFKYGGVGPYEATTQRMKYYWIPGKQWPKASSPIPPDGSRSVKSDRDSVMWLSALDTQYQVVSFMAVETTSQDLSGVLSKTCSSKVIWMSAEILAAENVYYLPSDSPLVSRKQYCWRVDTHTTQGQVLLGDVWSFETL